MINPNGVDWRPERDLNRVFEITPVRDTSPIKSLEELVSHIASQMLPEIVAYDGDLELQAEMVEEKARELWSSVSETVVQPSVTDVTKYVSQKSKAPAPVNAERSTTDWNQVANATTYVPSRS